MRDNEIKVQFNKNILKTLSNIERTQLENLGLNILEIKSVCT